MAAVLTVLRLLVLLVLAGDSTRTGVDDEDLEGLFTATTANPWTVGTSGELMAADGRMLSLVSFMPYAPGDWTLTAKNGDSVAEAGHDGNLRAYFFCRKAADGDKYGGMADCGGSANLRVAYVTAESAFVYHGDDSSRALLTPCDECEDGEKEEMCNAKGDCLVCMCRGEAVEQAFAAIDAPVAIDTPSGDCWERASGWSVKNGGLTSSLGCQRTAEALFAQLRSFQGSVSETIVATTDETGAWPLEMAQEALRAASSIVLVLVDLDPNKGSARHALLIETFEDVGLGARVYNSWVSSFTLVGWLDKDVRHGAIKSKEFGRGAELSSEALAQYFTLVQAEMKTLHYASVFRTVPKSCR